MSLPILSLLSLVLETFELAKKCKHLFGDAFIPKGTLTIEELEFVIGYCPSLIFFLKGVRKLP